MQAEVLPFTDLMLNTGAWTSWVPREEIRPDFQIDPHGGPGGGPALVISGAGNRLSCGCWQMPLKGIVSGRRYRIEALFQTEKIATPGKCVRAILTTGAKDQPRFFAHLDHTGQSGNWHRVGHVFVAPDPVPDLTVHVFLAWAPAGTVRWGDVRLCDVTGREETGHHKVHCAAISGNPENPTSPAQCLDFYTQRIQAIGTDVDVICLPELINMTGLPGRAVDWAEPIPGPTSERLSEAARQRGAYVAASILERQGDAVYNTGLLIDRNGGLVGKYRKTHLTLNEGLLCGYAPGNELPIFHTDFGVLAYMICYDGHYPEVPRLLALKGADIILFSNMGDGREGGSLWESFIRTRAIDNQVHIVAAVNGGRSCVVSPTGELLALTDKTPGATAVATCDLDASLCDFTKRPIHKRYDQLRRADLFGDLARHMWDG